VFRVTPRTDDLLQKNAARIPKERHPSLYAHKAILAFFESLKDRTFASIEEVGQCFETEWPKFAKSQEGYEPFSTFDRGFWLKLAVRRTSIETVEEGMGGSFWCGNAVEA
jgi:hypothetical protein